MVGVYIVRTKTTNQTSVLKHANAKQRIVCAACILTLTTIPIGVKGVL